MKFDIKLFFKNNWQHFAVFGIFIIITLAYFSPAFQGYTLKQADIQNYIGMSRETVEFQEEGEHIGWTNSMFGGMPTEQIAAKTDGNWVGWWGKVFSLGMPYATWAFIISMVCMYILLQTFRLKPFISAIGSIAYALTSYLIIVMKVGHTSKSFAMAYIPLVIAGFYLLYRRNWKLGILVSMMGMTMELTMNHVQITYYLAIILLFLGITELYKAFKEKNLKTFGIRTGMLIGSYLIAVLVNFALLFGTLDYTKYSTRGKSELTISPKDDANDQTDGLDRSYIVDWSYGIQETWTLMIPDAKGGVSKRIKYEEDLYKNIDSKYKAQIGDRSLYWGDQSYVEGPVYIGIIVVFLFLLGMVYIKDRLKWGILAAVVLGTFLSWGANFSGLTDFFIDHIPLYNKFRAVSMTLVIVEFSLPFLAILFIREMVQKPDDIKSNPKGFYIVTGIIGLILLSFLAKPDAFLRFESKGEIEGVAEYVKSLNDPNNPQMQQIPEAQRQGYIQQSIASINEIQADLIDVRIGIFREDVSRSLIFFLLAGGLLYLFIFRNVRNEILVVGGIGLLITVDLFTVDKRYLDNEKKGKEYVDWTKKINLQYPFYPEPGEQLILQEEVNRNPELAQALQAEDAKIGEFAKANDLKGQEVDKYRFYRYFRILDKLTHFRVHDYASGFNSGRSSYFHKTIGGYHGAKLKKYQEVWSFYFDPESKYLNPYTGQKVLNMLNTRYIMGIPQGQQVRMAQPNPGALGNAWLIQNVKFVANPDEEILALGDSTWNPATIAITQTKNEGIIGKNSFSGVGNVKLEHYHPTKMVYSFDSQEDQLVVFSEIFYPKYWNATIDGQAAEIINVNYILRAIKVPAGKHEIIMSYDNPNIDKYNSISKVGSSIFYVFFFGMIFLLYKDLSKQPKLEEKKTDSKNNE